MAELAGLILGGIPLVIWALEKYAEPLETFHHYRTAIETFRANLILQNRQLQTTLANVGLDNEASIEDVQECFETKFPRISNELMIIVQSMSNATAELMKNLEIHNQKGDTLSSKAQWEWRRVKHSFSTKKRNQVIENLRNWNDELRKALEKPELPAEDETPKVENIKRRFNLKRCGSIRQCFNSLHRALQAGLGCNCVFPHQAAIELDWAAFDYDAKQRFKVAISYGTTLQSTEPLDSWRRLQVALDASKNTTSSSPVLLTPATNPVRTPSPTISLRSRLAQLGRRSTDTTPLLQTPPEIVRTSSSTSTLTNNEIRNLCGAVCTDCKPWALTGTLKDPDNDDQERHFYLSHDKSESSNIIKALSLKSLISPNENPTKRNPCLALSAKQRYRIAASIAWSVLHLSGSPWLGDRWDEKQASIFLEKVHGQEMLSWHPCASYIFSSPPTPEELPADDFKHLIPNKSIFALGIFLIELCVNRPLTENQPSTQQETTTSLFEYYNAALSTLDEVYRLAGDSYGYAAERCVKFSFQGRDLYKNFGFSQFQQQFHDAVVAPVQATYLMLPDSRIPV